MDINHLAALYRALAISAAPTRSRRGLLAGLTNGLLAVLPLALGSADAAAKNKKKGRKKNKHKTPPSPPQSPSPPPPDFNAYGCLDVGQPCQGDSTLCCSGVCQGSAPAPGQPDTSVCVAHNAGICFADADICSVGAQVKCNPSNPSCTCLLTTGNAGFCGDLTHIDESCRLCSSDLDCQAEFGAGAACVVLGGACTAICAATVRTACVRPCV
jgi:hypothetical protein